MEMHGDRMTERGGKQLVFDHLRRHAHQRHRVPVIAAMVAGDIEHAEQTTLVVEDRRGRTGEEVVCIEIMLAAVHQCRHLFRERGADCVRALAALGPVGARLDRHLFRLFQKIIVAARMQHHAVGVGEKDDAVRVFDLFVQRIHDRQREVAQPAVLLQQQIQIAAPGMAEVRQVGLMQAIQRRAPT